MATTIEVRYGPNMAHNDGVLRLYNEAKERRMALVREVHSRRRREVRTHELRMMVREYWVAWRRLRRLAEARPA